MKSDQQRSYDSRRDDRHDERRREDHSSRYEDHSGGHHRERSRSPSPPEQDGRSKRELEEERRARMARLRSENEQEERQLAAVIEQQDQDGTDYGSKNKGPQERIIEVNPEELEGLDEEEQMKALLGFGGGFGSTKGEKVEDNHTTSAQGAAGKNKARKYSQYMNRKNGFNRPLDKMD
jgi:U4/U6.U5 tri-snRNP-associated protein 3